MTETYKTRAELVNRVAGILQISQIGQDVQPEDAELIDAQIDPTCASLASRGVIYVQPDQRIPLAIFEELAACIAANIPDYGSGLDSTAAEANLRFMQRKGPSFIPARADYF